jgi:hypothetical protein
VLRPPSVTSQPLTAAILRADDVGLDKLGWSIDRAVPEEHEVVKMSSLPGWDSVESSAAMAHVLHVTAVTVLFLLFIAEGLAVIYDARKDQLTTAAESARTAEQHRKDTQHAAEVSSLRAQLDQTAQHVAEDHSLKNRLRSLFASIDPQILHRIDSGLLDLTIRMQPADIERLQKLLTEPGGSSLAAITTFGRSWTSSAIANDTLGSAIPVPQQIEVGIKMREGLAVR